MAERKYSTPVYLGASRAAAERASASGYQVTRTPSGAYRAVKPEPKPEEPKAAPTPSKEVIDKPKQRVIVQPRGERVRVDVPPKETVVTEEYYVHEKYPAGYRAEQLKEAEQYADIRTAKPTAKALTWIEAKEEKYVDPIAKRLKIYAPEKSEGKRYYLKKFGRGVLYAPTGFTKMLVATPAGFEAMAKHPEIAPMAAAGLVQPYKEDPFGATAETAGGVALFAGAGYLGARGVVKPKPTLTYSKSIAQTIKQPKGTITRMAGKGIAKVGKEKYTFDTGALVQTVKPKAAAEQVGLRIRKGAIQKQAAASKFEYVHMGKGVTRVQRGKTVIDKQFKILGGSKTRIPDKSFDSVIAAYGKKGKAEQISVGRTDILTKQQVPKKPILITQELSRAKSISRKGRTGKHITATTHEQFQPEYLGGHPKLEPQLKPQLRPHILDPKAEIAKVHTTLTSRRVGRLSALAGASAIRSKVKIVPISKQASRLEIAQKRDTAVVHKQVSGLSQVTGLKTAQTVTTKQVVSQAQIQPVRTKLKVGRATATTPAIPELPPPPAAAYLPFRLPRGKNILKKKRDEWIGYTEKVWPLPTAKELEKKLFGGVK